MKDNVYFQTPIRQASLATAFQGKCANLNVCEREHVVHLEYILTLWKIVVWVNAFIPNDHND